MSPIHPGLVNNYIFIKKNYSIVTIFIISCVTVCIYLGSQSCSHWVKVAGMARARTGMSALNQRAGRATTVSLLCSTGLEKTKWKTGVTGGGGSGLVLRERGMAPHSRHSARALHWCHSILQ